jgi:toxin ParE1/3/4
MMGQNSPLQVRLTPQAEKDLEAIWIYTAANWSISQADSYLGELTDVFDLIAHAPLLARERLEFTPPVRMRRHQSHLIVYRVLHNDLDIVRIVHMKQNWTALFVD